MATGQSTSSFSAAALEKKLKDLNSSLQSIQGVSQWLVHYRRNAKTIVSVWYKELQKGTTRLVGCGSTVPDRRSGFKPRICLCCNYSCSPIRLQHFKWRLTLTCCVAQPHCIFHWPWYLVCPLVCWLYHCHIQGNTFLKNIYCMHSHVG